jgi:hypothetical protein
MKGRAGMIRQLFIFGYKLPLKILKAFGVD